MSGLPALDWAAQSVSLFNVILLLWLGLTVLLNAERRTRWIWLAGGGLLVGAAFFVSHSAILSYGLAYLSRAVEFWWRVGCVAIIFLPYSWYVLMLWYAGFWEQRPSRLYRCHHLWLLVLTGMTLLLIVLVASTRILPRYAESVELNLGDLPGIAGVPVLLFLYPLHALLNVALALDSLAHPEPSSRPMGNLARQRARGWLAGTSIALCITGLLVAVFLIWIVFGVRQIRTPFENPSIVTGLMVFDLLIATTIAAAVVLLGQAIVAYEIFTGHNLPRRGFSRHWHRILVLAAGYSGAVSWILVAGVRPIYGMMLTTAIVTTFFAMLVWRSFDEREQAIRQLRPFLAGQDAYDHVLSVKDKREVDVGTFFRALCETILDARVAYLIPAGSATALMRSPMVHPRGAEAPSFSLSDLAERIKDTEGLPFAVNPDRYGGAEWAVPLAREGGLSGLLLLGGKHDGGLYTQEEIEVARAGGERLVDMQVTAEMARRLMVLQRLKLAEGQLIDEKPRRILHDDVLPSLHAAMLSLRAGESPSDTVTLLARIHHQLSDLLREMPARTAPEVTTLGLAGAIRKVLAGELRDGFDEVSWEIDADVERKLAGIPGHAAEVIFHAAREALRNAAYHGRGQEAGRRLALQIRLGWEAGPVVEIADNGSGIDPSEAEANGGGQGLALHSTMMAVIGGTLEVDSAPGKGTRVTLRLPESSWN